MQVSAKLKNLRVSPRKTRLVADLVRGKNIDVARAQLQFSTKKTSDHILTLLNSAVANAKNNFNLDEKNLYIQNIIVEDGPILKRWTPRAQGRASAIHKRTCSVIVTLDEIQVKEGGKSLATKKAVPEVEDVKAQEIRTEDKAGAQIETKAEPVKEKKEEDKQI
jgi:large subunit ribosomal protein L22